MLTETRRNFTPTPVDMFGGNSIIIEAFELFDKVRANQSFDSNNPHDISSRERALAQAFVGTFGQDLRILVGFRRKIAQHPSGSLVNYAISYAASRLR